MEFQKELLKDWSEVFYYDETSPSCLRRVVDIKRGRFLHGTKGKVAGTLDKSKKSGYWNVTVSGVKYKIHRIIWEMFNGQLVEDFQIDHENGVRSDNKINNLRAVKSEINSRNRKKRCNNSSGVVGVRRSVNASGNSYWVASFTDNLTNKTKSKYFSILKLGDKTAFKMACEYRVKMIAELNEQGAGYTERHGE